jgi:hypothetical protein
MQTIIQIYPCLLKLLHKQGSVTDADGQIDAITISPHRYSEGIKIQCGKLLLANSPIASVK